MGECYCGDQDVSALRNNIKELAEGAETEEQIDDFLEECKFNYIVVERPR